MNIWKSCFYHDSNLFLIEKPIQKAYGCQNFENYVECCSTSNSSRKNLNADWKLRKQWFIDTCRDNSITEIWIERSDKTFQPKQRRKTAHCFEHLTFSHSIWPSNKQKNVCSFSVFRSCICQGQQSPIVPLIAFSVEKVIHRDKKGWIRVKTHSALDNIIRQRFLCRSMQESSFLMARQIYN